MSAPGVDADRAACRERLDEVTRRTRAGQSAPRIAWSLGVSVGTVHRYRAHARTGWQPHAGTGRWRRTRTREAA